MNTCYSFSNAQAVSLSKENDDWVLDLNWLADRADMDCLREIAKRQNLEMNTTGGHTVFRSAKKQP
jgi:hypothetical protein